MSESPSDETAIATPFSTEFDLFLPPSLTPSPEAYATEAWTASPTLSETLPPSLLEFTSSSTHRPTWTRTPFPTPIPPLAGIRITRPGLQSRLLSPFRVEAAAIPAPDGRLQLVLLGEDSRVLYNSSLRFAQTSSQQIFLQEEVFFSISGAAEAARLIIYTTDRFGRIISLSSVDLILLALGEEQITQPVSLREPLFIIRPYLNESFTNGLVSVRGLVSPVSNQPVILEIISEDNIVLFSSSLDSGPVTPERAYVPFEISIPFSISTFTRARLTLRQDSDNRIAGTVSLASQTISLSP